MNRCSALYATIIGVFILAAGLGMPQASVHAQDGQVAFSKPFEIFAVVWRGETEVENGFREYLDQRGINYNMTVRSLELDRGNAPPIIEEIRKVQPDLVYTWGTGTTRSIVGPLDDENPDQYVQGIPGIFVLVAYPISANIVEDYESPGRPITGVAFLASIESQLRAILDYGDFRKIAVIYDKTSFNSRINVEELVREAPQFGIELMVMAVPLGDDDKPDPAQLPMLIENAKAKGVELLYMGPDSFLTRHADLYTSHAITHGLPTFASTQAPLRGSRAMFGLVSDYHTLGKLAAVQAEKILVDEQHPEDLPVASLSRFKLWINIDVAREIKQHPPMNMITIADFQTTEGN